MSADKEQNGNSASVEDECDGLDKLTLDSAESLYKPPAQKTVKEILDADKEDESLRKYKETLLGSNAANVVIDANNPKNVIVRSLQLLVENRPNVTMDLSDLKSVDKKSFTLKEGVHYRLRINFHIQREIVPGLRYIQKAYRMGVQVHKDDYMVGSYAPKEEEQFYTTPLEEAPSGMMHRGSYKMKSLFTDDDQHDWLSWDWNLEIKKDWD